MVLYRFDRSVCIRHRHFQGCHLKFEPEHYVSLHKKLSDYCDVVTHTLNRADLRKPVRSESISTGIKAAIIVETDTLEPISH
jgi:hypothetical protein